MHIAPCLEAVFGFVVVFLSQDIIFARLRLSFSNQVKIENEGKTGWYKPCAICVKFKDKIIQLRA